MTPRTLPAVVLLAATTLVGGIRLAHAEGEQAPPASAKTPRADGKPSPLAPMQEAQRRFDAGVTLYEAKDLRGALAEFKAAYASDPVYRVLYNLGLVARELNDWAGALGYYRKYLDDGEERVPPGRRLQVEREILELAQRVARLEIDVTASGVEVQIDDEAIAPARLAAPIAVNPGKRRVRVTYPDCDPETRTVEVAGGEVRHLVFDPEPTTPSRAAAAAAKVRDASRADHEEDPPGWGKEHRTGASSGRLTTFTWIATGALLAGGGVVGYLARQSSQQLVRDRMRYPVDGAMLGSLRSRTQMLSTAADGLLIGSALLAAVSAYLTWGHTGESPGTKPPHGSNDSEDPPPATALAPLPAGTFALSHGWSF